MSSFTNQVLGTSAALVLASADLGVSSAQAAQGDPFGNMGLDRATHSAAASEVNLDYLNAGAEMELRAGIAVTAALLGALAWRSFRARQNEQA